MHILSLSILIEIRMKVFRVKYQFHLYHLIVLHYWWLNLFQHEGFAFLHVSFWDNIRNGSFARLHRENSEVPLVDPVKWSRFRHMCVLNLHSNISPNDESGFSNENKIQNRDKSSRSGRIHYKHGVRNYPLSHCVVLSLLKWQHCLGKAVSAAGKLEERGGWGVVTRNMDKSQHWLMGYNHVLWNYLITSCVACF